MAFLRLARLTWPGKWAIYRRMPTPSLAVFNRRRLGILAGALLLLAGATWLLRDRGPAPDSAPTAATEASAPVAAPAESLQPAAASIAETAPPPSAPAAVAEPAAPPTVAAGYDQRIAALLAAVESRRAAGEAAVRRQIPELLSSKDPMDPIIGLALLAGFNAWDLQPDWAGFAPEIPLAAADLCAALFEPQVARDLLVQWMSRAGGPQAAGEKAHDLLLKAALPYGGGTVALDFMQGANDPQAIFIGLYEFAVDPRLPGTVRSEALVRLRARMDPDAYRDLVRECADRARADDEDWALRAERLRARLDAAVDRRFVETELADPYPGLVEDLEIQLRHGLAEERLEIDPGTAAFFRDALVKLDAATLSGPDRAAALRLRRLLESKLR